MQKLYSEFKPKGLELVAINIADDKPRIAKYLADNHWSFPIGLEVDGDRKFRVSEQFKVHTFPSNFLIDPSGQVVWNSIGFEEPELRKALTKVGL